ncbi:MAG: transcription-repair coupling factor [Bacillota bacterium]|jgi:transcription-repair coupling factor (superfamily II helicase)|nr:transcription-repair coupling factor [Bacillota bacterium]NLL26463.1 transcription-repair coupling factor [Erysipelotrichia bacterium]
MINFYQLLEKDPAVLALNENIEKINGLTETEETLVLAASFHQQQKTKIVIKGNMYSAQQLYYRLYPLLKDDVLLFTMEESLRVEAVAASPSMYANQMEVLTTLCLEDEPKVIITHPMAVIRYLPKKETFEKRILNLSVSQRYSMNSLKNDLIKSGYKQTARIDQPLTFSLRGGVIDVFSIQDEKPIRIEFFDDEIDSIRYFDISTQRTIKQVKECKIVPASLLIFDEDFSSFEQRVKAQLKKDKKKARNFWTLKDNVERDINYLKNNIFEHYLYRYQCFKENIASLLDYVTDKQVIISTDDDARANLELIIEENCEYINELYSNDLALNYYSVFDDFYRVIEKHNPYHIKSSFFSLDSIKSKVKMTYFPLLPLDKVVEEIVRLAKRNKIVLSINNAQKELLENAFSDEKLKLEEYVEFTDVELFEGFNYEDIIVLTAKELFGVKIVKGRYENKFKEAIVLESYTDLKIGDYVVHNQHGIGKYEGIVTKEIQNKHRDYLQIRYRDDDLLLVPLEQFKMVRKFLAAEGVGVRLSKLGSKSWQRSKNKIQAEVDDIAERLVELYSAREENIGFAFSKDDEHTRKFEANFPYQLTEDQKKAIAEIKYDMEQPRPMDRLLCGDVGFGKTEVAMVAAFKAVKDLKQVAYLCPTTILSLQHYNTFVDRFRGFPVKIRLLNRYVVFSQQKQIIKELKEGKIDILIGTHRIISNDVKFADLGLLIIDEEQRFGVQAKEKIKEYKKSIDVLSLSATPIPRTLQMSLVGVMSLSQLDTAPQDRMPIQTYVVEKNDSLIREVISRELARNGQVFYLYNNVSNIYNVARKISTMVPNATVAVGHGKMNREEIEDVMYRFINKEFNILICTTIIETGIDIPNVNTIIIEDADRFGLAQLYQIRGRVGRSNKVAYAYLMYHGNKQLSETATRRLQAIKEFTELGSGYKIAMRDLTIRGAGDLLGERQAGFINTIGMSLYLEMLNKAINKQKGIVEEEIEESRNRVSEIDGYIPGQFVNEDLEKIEIYQKLALIKNKKELVNYQKELTDYYGKLPTMINNLFEKKRLELMLNTNRIASYEEYEKENRIVLTAEYSSTIDGVKFFERISKISNEIDLEYKRNQIILIFEKKKNYINRIAEALEVINDL